MSQEVKFDKPLYRLRAVKAAVKDFSKFATFTVDNRKTDIVVRIDDIESEVRGNFAEEFCNYVIGMMK